MLDGQARALMHRGLMGIRRHRSIVFVIEGALWALALVFAALVRHDFVWADVDVGGLVTAVLVASLVSAVVGAALGSRYGRWRVASFEDAVALGVVVLVTGAVLSTANLLAVGFLPRGAAAVAAPIAFVLILACRCAARLVVGPRRRAAAEDAHRLIVFGAGSAGTMVTRSLLTQAGARYLPVAVLDDDPHKRGRRVAGLPVAGGRDALPEVAARTGADTLLIAIPSAPAVVIRDLSEAAVSAGLTTRVLPSVRELVDGSVGSSDIRALTEADLLGRRAIDTDLSSIAGYLTGRRVLVTGAGGSIGSELCRQLHRYAPARLVMLDRDESALHSVQLSIEGRALLDSPDLVLADIRDGERLRAVFAEHRPEVVFHAAAHKHLTLLERNPGEAVKTNVWGTQNVLEAARDVGVQRFVNISTDKAARPTNMLGLTKRVAERLTAAMAEETGRPFLSVRFGNVLGSRGSVVPTFRAQIDAGGPVTVTAPEVTRYFMTVEEAVQLTIQAGAMGESGDAFILDMGEPVRISDLAHRLVEASGRDVRIVYTGLRPGEKVHEDLAEPDDVVVPSSHPLIMRTHVPPLDRAAVHAWLRRADGVDLRAEREALDVLVHSEADASPAARPVV